MFYWFPYCCLLLVPENVLNPRAKEFIPPLRWIVERILILPAVTNRKLRTRVIWTEPRSERFQSKDQPYCSCARIQQRSGQKRSSQVTPAASQRWESHVTRFEKSHEPMQGGRSLRIVLHCLFLFLFFSLFLLTKGNALTGASRTTGDVSTCWRLAR